MATQDTSAEQDTIRSHARDDLIVALFFLLIGVGMIVVGMTAPPPPIDVDRIGPYGFPVLVGVLIAICSLIVILRAANIWRSGDVKGEREVIAGRRDDDEPDLPASGLKAVLMAAATLGFGLLLEPLGYIIAAILFVTVGLLLMGVRSWKMIAGNAIVFTIVTFLLFGQVLSVPVPLGPLTELFVEWNIVDAVR